MPKVARLSDPSRDWRFQVEVRPNPASTRPTFFRETARVVIRIRVAIDPVSYVPKRLGAPGGDDAERAVGRLLSAFACRGG